MSGHDSDGPSCVSEKFLEHAQFPRNMGVLPSFDGRGDVTGSCGDSMTATIRVDGDRVAEVKASPNGCSFTVACASAMTILAKGRTLDECLALTPSAVSGLLGGLPEDHLHCARMAVNALHEAIGDHYAKTVDKAAS